MRISVMKHTVAAALLAYAAPVLAQHAEHAGAGVQPTPAASAQVAACVQSQQQAMALVDIGNRRLELARQTNEPLALRTAMDDFQTILSAVRTQLASCAQLAAAAPGADTPAGHVMPNVQAAPSAAPGTPATAPRSVTPAPAASGGASAHAGHGVAATPTAAPKRAGAAAPPKGTGATVDHSKMNMGAATPAAAPKAAEATQPALVEDPVSKTKVDPGTSLRLLYQGKTYYFRSDMERQEFMKNPRKYVSPQ